MMTPIMMEETASEMETKATIILLIMFTISVTLVIRVPTRSVYCTIFSSSPFADIPAL